ncbi:MAG: hypothetical protein JWP12_3812 [Bacteroidetes bacterium]|nr:hypothetical protein [Bacteroidota bacterium]
MENQNEIKISIPKPCHENWNEMTPNEKGSFCMKCAKTVVDFTKKTTEEIRDFLTEQRGNKICGRFMNDQLEGTPKPIDLLIPIHLLPKKLSFRKAFVFAVFIAFGTTLFSCSTQQGEIIEHVSAVTDTAAAARMLPPELDPLKGDTIITEHSKVATKGKVACTPLQGDVDVEIMCKGEIVETPNDTIIKKDTVIDTEPTMGKIKIVK